jgi:hypothetical protein
VVVRKALFAVLVVVVLAMLVALGERFYSWQ